MIPGEQELARKLAELKVKLAPRLEEAKSKDAAVRKHLADLKDVGVEVRAEWGERPKAYDFYGNIRYEFMKEADRLCREFLDIPDDTKILIIEEEQQERRAQIENDGLRPGYDTPTSKR
jgi:hypothetical protein